jgi:hypothetical protein
MPIVDPVEAPLDTSLDPSVAACSGWVEVSILRLLGSGKVAVGVHRCAVARGAAAAPLGAVPSAREVAALCGPPGDGVKRVLASFRDEDRRGSPIRRCGRTRW